MNAQQKYELYKEFYETWRQLQGDDRLALEPHLKRLKQQWKKALWMDKPKGIESDPNTSDAKE